VLSTGVGDAGLVVAWVGVGLCDADGEADCDADGEAEFVTSPGPDEAELDVDGSSLGDSLVAGHDGSAVGESVGVADALSAGTASSDADAEGSSRLAVGLAESVGPVGVAVPVQAASAAVDCANPEFAGMTSRAPTAIVPVATAPATEAADRPLRTCLGTVPAPNFS
jgi:hypothetical protein